MSAPFQRFEKLDEHTLNALRDSIATCGVLVPVIVDQRGRILDGHHRVAICEELEVNYPTHLVDIDDDAHGEEIADTVNAIRRHLDPVTRREVVSHLRAKGHSLRAIARATGASVGTVHADAAASGVQPEHVTGTDGKDYAPTRPTATVTDTETTTRSRTVDLETGEIADPPQSSSAEATPSGEADAEPPRSTQNDKPKAEKEERPPTRAELIAAVSSWKAKVTTGISVATPPLVIEYRSADITTADLEAYFKALSRYAADGLALLNPNTKEAAKRKPQPKPDYLRLLKGA